MIVKSPKGETLGIFAGKVLELSKGDTRLTIAGNDFSVVLTTEGNERVYLVVKDDKIEVEAVNSGPDGEGSGEDGKEKPEENNTNGGGEGENNGGGQPTDPKTPADGGTGSDGSENGDEGKGKEGGEVKGDGTGGEGSGAPGTRRYTRV